MINDSGLVTGAARRGDGQGDRKAKPLPIVRPLIFPPADEEATDKSAPAVPLAAIRQPNFTHHGGRLLTSVEIITVFWGLIWQQARIGLVGQLSDFFDFILNSSLVNVLTEYGVPGQPITPGWRVGTFLIPGPSPASRLTAHDIERQLRTWVSGGVLPPPRQNSLYFLYLPPGVTVRTFFGTSCVDFAGYHSFIDDIVFAVVPDCNAGAIECLTTISSHELCEAIM
jgi:hypothetical protein